MIQVSLDTKNIDRSSPPANSSSKLPHEKQQSKSETPQNPFINLLHQYSENSPGQLLSQLKAPRWLQNFLLLSTHLTPLVGTVSLLKNLPLPKQLNSILSLASMYLGVWGNKKLGDFPKVASLTAGSSLFCDWFKMPDIARRSLIGLILTAGQEMNLTNIADKKLILDCLKKLGLKILQTEIKVNSSIPLSDLISKNFSNPLIASIVKILSLSGTLTACSEIFHRIGWIDKSQFAALASAIGCPICGGAAVGECISAEIGPIASVQDQLHSMH